MSQTTTALVGKVNEATFENEVTESNIPVVVDFTAAWCPPCKALAPVLERVAGQYVDQVKIVKVDVDENPLLAQRFGALNIPNLLFFKDGQVVNQHVGYLNEIQLSDKVAQLTRD